LGRLEEKTSLTFASIPHSLNDRKITFHHIHAASLRQVPTGPNPLHN